MTDAPERERYVSPAPAPPAHPDIPWRARVDDVAGRMAAASATAGRRVLTRAWLRPALIGAAVAGAVALLVSLAVVDTWRTQNESLRGRIAELDAAAAEQRTELREVRQARDTAAAERDSAEARADEMAGSLAGLRRELNGVERERDDLAANALAVEDLEARAAAVASAEAALDEREAAVTALEDEAAARSFGGGVWLVGEDIEPGTYRNDGIPDGGPACYWQISPAGSDDIIDNDIVSAGRPTVRLSAGQEFKSERCGTWTRSGG